MNVPDIFRPRGGMSHTAFLTLSVCLHVQWAYTMILRHVFRRLVLLHDIIVYDVHPSLLEPTLLLFPCTCMFNMWYHLHIWYPPLLRWPYPGYQSYLSEEGYHWFDVGLFNIPVFYAFRHSKQIVKVGKSEELCVNNTIESQIQRRPSTSGAATQAMLLGRGLPPYLKRNIIILHELI